MSTRHAKVASAHRSCCCTKPPVPRTRLMQPLRLLQCRISPETRCVFTQQLDLELKSLQGMSAVLPGNVEAKQRILQVIEQLELQSPTLSPLYSSSSSSSSGSSSSSSTSSCTSSSLSPAAELLGDWDLVYANNGTVVTRTGFAQSLVQLAGKLPGFGLKDIVQSLYVGDMHPGCVRSTNQAEFGLGPFGSWRVAIRGSWLPAGQAQPDNTALVVFDEFGVQLTGWLLKLPKALPEVRIRLPKSNSQQQQGRPAALWQTTYLDGAYRVGRGSSGNVFLFRRRRLEYV